MKAKPERRLGSIVYCVFVAARWHRAPEDKPEFAIMNAMIVRQKIVGLSAIISVALRSIAVLPAWAFPPERDLLFGPTVQRTAIEDFITGDGDGTSLVFADFDNDGCPDALVATAPAGFLNGDPTFVAVLRGHCNGSFDVPVQYGAGLEPAQALPIDIDGDGWLDIVACNASDNTVSILRNRGDGTFEDQVAYPAGNEPRSMIVGDVNGDGLDDVVALNTLSGDVSVLLNAGDGTLLPETRVPVGGVTPRGDGNRNFPFPGPFMGAGDLDGDGDIDLAIPARRRVKLLINDGQGQFAPGQELGAPDNDVYQTLVTDLNWDGLPDIACSIFNFDERSSLAVVFRNAGAGSFLPGDVYDVNVENGVDALTTVDAGDIDGDGDADLAFGGWFLRESHPILLNDGTGLFDTLVANEIFQEPWVVTLEDLTGDCLPDLSYLTTRIRSALRMHPNDGTGRFIGPAREPRTDIFTLGSRPSIEVADVDGDGDPDAIGARQRDMFLESRIDVLINDGTGDLDWIEVLDDPEEMISIERVLAVDFRLDGVPEIVAGDTGWPGGFDQAGRLWLIENDGALGFSPRIIHEFGESFPLGVEAADVDGDGDIDLVASHVQMARERDDFDEPQFRRIRVLLNRGDETFEMSQDLHLETIERNLYHGGLALADLDGDGDLDIAGETSKWNMPGILVTFLNDGSGRFEENARIETAPHPESIRAGDVDGDGAIELVVLCNHNTTLDALHPHIQVFDLVDGTPVLAHEETDIQILSEGAMRLVDIDRDGYLDCVYGDVAGRVIVQRGRGDGTFEDAEGYSSNGVFAVAVGDFNGDTRLDTIASTLGGIISWYDVNLNRSLFSPCPADVTGSSDPDDPRYGVPDTMVTLDDFLVFLDLFAAGSPRADISGSSAPGDDGYGVPDGVHDVADFFTYLDRFAEGCPES